MLLKLSKLSDDRLLYKCMHDGIQTSYDSFHHLIWKRCPKSVFVGRKRLDVAIDAAIVCNEGETGRVPIFSIRGCPYAHLLLHLRSPRDYVVRSSVRPSVRPSSVRSRLWYVLDRQLLNG